MINDIATGESQCSRIDTHCQYGAQGFKGEAMLACVLSAWFEVLSTRTLAAVGLTDREARLILPIFCLAVAAYYNLSLISASCILKLTLLAHFRMPSPKFILPIMFTAIFDPQPTKQDFIINLCTYYCAGFFASKTATVIGQIVTMSQGMQPA